MERGETTSKRWIRPCCQSVPTIAIEVIVFPVPLTHFHKKSGALTRGNIHLHHHLFFEHAIAHAPFVRENQKVFRSVVLFVAIYVMYNLTCFEGAA